MNIGNQMSRRIEGETFEQWVRRNTMVNTELTGDLKDIKNITKQRDSGRVAFLENQKYYSNVESQLQNEKLANEEREILTKSLTKYFERSMVYLSRYDQAKVIIIEHQAKLKELKEMSKQANDSVNETEVA
jgi:hypothetical protein